MLAMAVACLVLSTGVTWITYRALSSRLTPPEQTKLIVVAAKKLKLGSKLSDADLSVVAWPKNVDLEGSFNQPEQIIGRGLMTSVALNEPILESKLAPRNGGAGLAPVIPEGMRAVGVRVNDVIGVAGFALPGTRVDVILSGAPNRDREVDTAKIFLENVLILAADQNIERDANGKPQNVQVITLLLTPEEAEKIALASVDGRIQLALRNPLDHEPKDPPPVFKRNLYETKNAATRPVQTAAAVRRAPSPPPPPVPQAPPVPEVIKEQPAPKPVSFNVEIIQGAKRENVSHELKQAVQE
jgi:pilus assembly protein CpaB